MRLCNKSLPSRANNKYDPPDLHKCQREAGHDGRCAEFPYLHHLDEVAPRIAQKIRRDATKTTGASWKSEDAGPNRISRWTMLLSDAELKELGINMAGFKPWVVAKLRDKAATYQDCMDVARRLTWLAYGMSNAQEAPDFVRAYLEPHFGPIVQGTTQCLVCRAPLDFSLFHEARRGRAEIETAHAQPRSHTSANVGFAHRHCNIAQGDKSLEEFYEWIAGILHRAERIPQQTKHQSPVPSYAVFQQVADSDAADSRESVQPWESKAPSRVE